MKRMKSLLGAVGALMGAGALMGCGGLSPGDYEVYRVAFGTMKESQGCFTNQQLPGPLPDVASDTSDLRATATWILYAGPDDKLYLDTGAVTIEGQETDDGYEFVGKLVDVMFDMPDGTGSKRTTTITTTVSITTDGNAISGEAEEKRSFACVGSTCGTKLETCSHTTPFVGTYVEDVQLNYDIAPPSK